MSRRTFDTLTRDEHARLCALLRQHGPTDLRRRLGVASSTLDRALMRLDGEGLLMTRSIVERIRDVLATVAPIVVRGGQR
jgi:DNA-binding MarR family transcriptional regulator